MTGKEFLQFIAGRNGERLMDGQSPKLLATETRVIFHGQPALTLYLVRMPIQMPDDWSAESPDYWLTDVTGLDLG